VTEEVIVKGQGRPGAGELATALGAWVTETAPDVSMVQQFSPALSVADREVLAVAHAEAVDYILTDDRELRREASRHHLDCLRVAEVLALLKDRGLVPEIKLHVPLYPLV
jgi:predicted nucleic acid-binding protein